MPVDETCKRMTTFTCKQEKFRFEIMPFGLRNAPATFQRMMNQVLKDLPYVRVNIDDAIIFSSSLEEKNARFGRSNENYQIRRTSD